VLQGAAAGIRALVVVLNKWLFGGLLRGRDAGSLQATETARAATTETAVMQATLALLAHLVADTGRFAADSLVAHIAFRTIATTASAAVGPTFPLLAPGKAHALTRCTSFLPVTAIATTSAAPVGSAFTRLALGQTGAEAAFASGDLVRTLAAASTATIVATFHAIALGLALAHSLYAQRRRVFAKTALTAAAVAAALFRRALGVAKALAVHTLGEGTRARAAVGSARVEPAFDFTTVGPTNAPAEVATLLGLAAVAATPAAAVPSALLVSTIGHAGADLSHGQSIRRDRQVGSILLDLEKVGSGGQYRDIHPRELPGSPVVVQSHHLKFLVQQSQERVTIEAPGFDLQRHLSVDDHPEEIHIVSRADATARAFSEEDIFSPGGSVIGLLFIYRAVAVDWQAPPGYALLVGLADLLQ